ncbi:MAG: DUF131 domain-containing protein [Candidatus Methanofastidiosa archaeon]|nr:DUF131 domain-containing protein [Candidatus Methanofastidiosa archaeon]NYT14037.1 DUF131 domain-containing protein [Candidatus Methanofastidiosa archaeon]
MYFERLIPLGFIFILIGILIIVAGTFLSSFKGDSESHIETGGVIFIGPIPILFGNSRPLIFISIAGAVILMVVYYLISRGDIIR